MLFLIVTLSTFLFTWYLRVYSGIMPVEGGLLSFKAYLVPVILMIPIYIFIYNFKGLYNNERIMFLSKEVGNIITSNVLGILIFTGVLFISKQIDYSRSILVLFFLVNITITSIERFVVRKFIKHL